MNMVKVNMVKLINFSCLVSLTMDNLIMIILAMVN
jgi:hypothetical protein